MILDNLTIEEINFLGKINQEFKNKNLNGNVYLINEKINGKIKILNFIVNMVSHKDIILNLKKDVEKFIPCVYVSNISKYHAYCKIY